jgi:hypothetical protein
MSHLTRRQIQEFIRRVKPMLDFFYRCKRRLEAPGFKDSDKVFKGVKDVHQALHALHFELWESGPFSGRKRDEELPPHGDRTF